MSEEMANPSAELAQPIIVDLGKQKAKNLKALKKGKGKLWGDLFSVVEEVKDRLGEAAENKVLVPVVVMYRKPPKRKRLSKALFARRK